MLYTSSAACREKAGCFKRAQSYPSSERSGAEVWAHLSGRGHLAAGLRQRPALGQRQAVRWGGQAEALGGVWTRLAPPGGLSVGRGDLLQVDGSFHGLEKDVPLFGVELKVPFAGVAAPTRLEGESGLKKAESQRRSHRLTSQHGVMTSYSRTCQTVSCSREAATVSAKNRKRVRSQQTSTRNLFTSAQKHPAVKSAENPGFILKVCHTLSRPKRRRYLYGQVYTMSPPLSSRCRASMPARRTPSPFSLQRSDASVLRMDTLKSRTDAHTQLLFS